MPVKYITCTCVELGCAKQTHLDAGIMKAGFRMSQSAYVNHQNKIREKLRQAGPQDVAAGTRPISTVSQVKHPWLSLKA